MARKLKVTLIRSPIHRPSTQKETVKGLGLRRLNKSSVLEDTPSVRGMIRKVQHLVTVEPADESLRSREAVRRLLRRIGKRRVARIYHPRVEDVAVAVGARVVALAANWDKLEDIKVDESMFLSADHHQASKDAGG